MLDSVKVFIELHKDLIAKEDWKKFYQAVYDVKLSNYQVEELIHVFSECDIDIATDVRNELLFDELVTNLKKAKKMQVSYEAKTIKDSYVVQFLRGYLVNMFGFTLEQTIELMWNNQTLLGIKLTPAHKVSPGQNGIRNYKIEFVN